MRSIHSLVILIVLAACTGGEQAAATDWANSLPAVNAPVTRLESLESPGHAATPPTPPRDARNWPQPVGEVVGSPVLYDLNGDGTHEVIITDDWFTYVFDHTGALWPGWPVHLGDAQQHPAVADLDGDDVAEIIVATSFPGALLHVVDQTGAELPGWPVSIPVTVTTNLTCPVVADIDGDDAPDVGVAGEQGVFFFHVDGTPLAGWPYLWPVPVNNPQWSAPAVGDLDLDGGVEIVVGNACYPDWGVHAVDADGTALPGWPKVIKPVFSSPALADLDGDGDLEIIAQEGDPGSQGYRMWVWHHDGTNMAGWPHAIAAEGHSSRCNPAVADVDGDGTLEIVTATSDGLLHVLRPDGTEYPGYPHPTGAPDYSIISSPAVADMDDDGVQEIFLTYWFDFAHYLGAWRLGGAALDGFPKTLITGSDLNAHCSTHVLDIEGDGDLDVATAASTMSSGVVWVIEVDGSSMGSQSVADWPKIRRDLRNTGCRPSADPAGVAAASSARPAALTLSPNPWLGAGSLSFTPPQAGRGRLEILDVSGRRILMRSVTGSEETLRLSPAELADRQVSGGVYLVRWTPLHGGGPRTARLLSFAR